MRLTDLFETAPPVFKTDNPGGEWLQRKQDMARERHKFMDGPITGYFTGLLPLPTKFLITLPGARGEEEYRTTSVKMDWLNQNVTDPAEFDTRSYPILVGVNHFGDAYIIEGNHRVAYAHMHGIDTVYGDVRYYNGGEAVRGRYSPRTIIELCGD